MYRTWTQSLSKNIELLAVQLPGRENRFSEFPYTDMWTLVKRLGNELSPYLDRPYAIFGHSLGALTAFEFIREVRRRREPMPELFFPSAYHAPHMPDRNSAIYDSSDEEFIARLRKYKGTPTDVLENAGLMKVFLPRLRADFKILGTYVHEVGAPLSCPIVAFDGTDDDNVNEEELLAWKIQTNKSFEFHTIVGDHFYVKSAESEIIKIINEKINNRISTNYAERQICT